MTVVSATESELEVKNAELGWPRYSCVQEINNDASLSQQRLTKYHWSSGLAVILMA